jgi:sugar phosphate permease
MSATPQDRKRSGLYYGWYVIGAMFFMALVGVGPRQGLGLFFDRWTEEFGVSISMLSAMAGAGWLVNGIAHPFIGSLTDRYGGRIVMSISMIVVGAGSLLLGLSYNLWMLALVYVPLVSVGMAGILFVPASALASRWFKRKRGTAISMLTSGASVGGMLMVPFMAYMLDVVDWRITWMVVGGMLLVSSPLLWFVLRNNPRELGLWPDGDSGPSDDVATTSTTGLGREGPLAVERWQTAYRSNPMWVLTFGYIVCGITTGSIAVHFVPYAVSEGISVTTAALAFALLNLINLAGVLTTGVISDRILRKNLLTVVYGVRGLAFLALVVFPPDMGLWVFAIVGGMSWLASVPQVGALTAEIYGIQRAGTLNGMLTLVHQIGGAAAVFGAGLVFDLSGSYKPFFIVAAGTLVFASLVSWVLRERACSVRFIQADAPPGLVGEGA